MSRIKVMVVGHGVYKNRNKEEVWKMRVVELTRLPCVGETIVLPDGWGAVVVEKVCHYPEDDAVGDAAGGVSVTR